MEDNLTLGLKFSKNNNDNYEKNIKNRNFLKISKNLLKMGFDFNDINNFFYQKNSNNKTIDEKLNFSNLSLISNKNKFNQTYDNINIINNTNKIKIKDFDKISHFKRENNINEFSKYSDLSINEKNFNESIHINKSEYIEFINRKNNIIYNNTNNIIILDEGKIFFILKNCLDFLKEKKEKIENFQKVCIEENNKIDFELNYSNQSNDKICSVCYENLISKDIIYLTCNHYFCVSCVNEFFITCILENNILNLKCLEKNCTNKIVLSELFNEKYYLNEINCFFDNKKGYCLNLNLFDNSLKEILQIIIGEKLVEKLKKFYKKNRIANDKNKINCPFPNCNSYALIKYNLKNKKKFSLTNINSDSDQSFVKEDKNSMNKDVILNLNNDYTFNSQNFKVNKFIRKKNELNFSYDFINKNTYRSRSPENIFNKNHSFNLNQENIINNFINFSKINLDNHKNNLFNENENFLKIDSKELLNDNNMNIENLSGYSDNSKKKENCDLSNVNNFYDKINKSDIQINKYDFVEESINLKYLNKSQKNSLYFKKKSLKILNKKTKRNKKTKFIFQKPKAIKNFSKFVQCLTGHKFCYKCFNLNWHFGVSCNKKEDNDFLFWLESNNKNIKNCPNCNFWTEKLIGCNHMECPNCKHEWCWLCLNKFSTNHYSDPKSKCNGRMFEGVNLNLLNNMLNDHEDFENRVILRNFWLENFNGSTRDYYTYIGRDCFRMRIRNYEFRFLRIINGFLEIIRVLLFNYMILAYFRFYEKKIKVIRSHSSRFLLAYYFMCFNLRIISLMFCIIPNLLIYLFDIIKYIIDD